MGKFLNGNLSKAGRIFYLLAAVLLGLSLLFPWWTLRLEAPQYPEGLSMSVYAYKLAGGKIPSDPDDVDDIYRLNILNHYIGMMEIDEGTFTELTVMPWVVGALALLVAAAALVRRNWLAIVAFLTLGAGGVVGMNRMFHWLNTFGSDLDPKAAIKIDPFVPPVMGQNTLANFKTWSSFGLGGYLVGVAVVLMVVALVLAFRRYRQWDKKSSSVVSQSSS
ncbi:MAG: hypothetical protein LBB49_07040 [Gracilibacteraceae bacterium]|jgi:hypothetical protein|nr:hypothetical protein [Gracilibacteraceae bacterium]